MDIEQVNDFARFLYNYFFQEELIILIKQNNRLKRTHAWFVYDNENDPYIEVSKHLITQDIHIIADILVHELTHYYLFKNNKPFDDEDIEFLALTYKNGISRTKSTSLRKNEIMYQYSVYESKCECGFCIHSYFQIIDNNFRPTLICPNCNKDLPYNYIICEYKKYKPTFKIKNACEFYKKQKERI